MANPDNWLGFAALLAFLIFLVASWLLHRRLRNPQSLRFFLSSLALIVSLPISSLATNLVLTYSDPEKPGQLANWLVITSEVLLPATLFVLFALSFLLAVKSIAPQPNNSSKPTPLRGVGKAS